MLKRQWVSFCQDINSIINKAEVERIEKVLAGDDMQGRKPGTPGIEKAADFIAGNFKSIGLQPLKGLKNYRQQFVMIQATAKEAAATLNGQAIDPKKLIAFTSRPELSVTEKSGYEKVHIKGYLN